MTTPTEFPKIIYAFWMQGRKNAPELVKINFDRWERLNPDYKLIVFDKDSALDFLADFPIDASKLAVQAFADILRMQLLRKNGGIWTDASVYPTVPLSVWLAPYMELNTFFAYESTWVHCDRHGLHYQAVINWFLAAQPNCPIMGKWGDLMERYWFMERESIHKETLGDENRPPIYHPADIDAEMGLPDMRPTAGYPYFWPHHLFGHLLHHNAEFAALWNALEPRDYEPTQALLNMPRGIFTHHSKSIRRQLRTMFRQLLFRLSKQRSLKKLLANAPMQKLDWRANYPLDILKNMPL